MARKNLQVLAATTHQTQIPGLVFNADKSGMSFSANDVAAPVHYFRATDFRLDFEKREAIILLGSNSHYDDALAAFNLAIELRVPAPGVRDCFIESVWVNRSLLTSEPFVKSLEMALGEEEIERARRYECKRNLPEDRQYHRTLPGNYASLSVFNGQANIEFFLVPFSHITYRATGRARKGDEVQSVVSVILSEVLLYALLWQIKQWWDRPDNAVARELDSLGKTRG